MEELPIPIKFIDSDGNVYVAHTDDEFNELMERDDLALYFD